MASLFFYFGLREMRMQLFIYASKSKRKVLRNVFESVIIGHSKIGEGWHLNMPSPDKKRVSYFADPDAYNQLQYFVSQYPERWSSTNEFLRAAVAHYVAHLNGDYDLPVLEIQRLHQFHDQLAANTSSIDNMSDIVVNMYKSLMRLMRGGNYLLDSSDDDGEL